jgi:LysM repeat protein
MDRVCPFLALEADLRSAMSGYDPEHRCLAQDDRPPIDRGIQQGRCLAEDHVSCEWYLQRIAVLAQHPRRPPLPPDARFISTRLILEPDDGWRPIGLTPRPIPRNRIALTGATVLLLGTAGVALSTRGFGLMTAAVAPTSQPTATPSQQATAQPTQSPSAAPTPSPSSRSATPTLRPATPSPRSTPHVYVAQKGDSLSSIAARFGVSVQALLSANGLSNPNLVNIGQVLVIPD